MQLPSTVRLKWKRESCHKYKVHGQTPHTVRLERKLSTVKHPQQHDLGASRFRQSQEETNVNKYVNCHFAFLYINATIHKQSFSFISPICDFPLKILQKASSLPQTLCRRAFREDHTGKKLRPRRPSASPAGTHCHTRYECVVFLLQPSLLPNRFGVTPRMAADNASANN